MNVTKGPVANYGFKNPGGWVCWGPVGVGYWTFGVGYWTFENGEGLGQVQIFSSNGSGHSLVDEITVGRKKPPLPKPLCNRNGIHLFDFHRQTVLVDFAERRLIG